MDQTKSDSEAEFTSAAALQLTTWLEGLTRMLTLLSQNGIKHYEGPIWNYGSCIEVDFHAPALSVPAISEAKALTLPGTKPIPEDICDCGHELSSHSDTGECYHSCPVSECHPDEPKRPPPESAS
jgi:hypothetical protein